ncbi:DJ-1/PfpI family protein [Mycolicibacterium baixiangningiae]|uniref:DJ-1/PfpI family protein n=1 Tax=Mycolicibacterium baixiangningiae TaxID=2761578 RepID=UPI001868ED32|nr:DJ-1/PfpI family protein [Mycolicibacterium baixiangningiae]
MPTNPENTRVVVLAADFFEESELIYPALRLREEGYEVSVAGVGTAPVRGKSAPPRPRRPDACADRLTSLTLS